MSARVPAAVLLLALPLTAQADDLVAALCAGDAVGRETARRRLAVAASLPEKELTALLDYRDAAVVLAAATLLRDRGLATERLRALAAGHADLGVRRALLGIAGEQTLRAILAEGPADLAPAALYALEDRGLLDDALLLASLATAAEPLADAACSIVVGERAPFPLEVVDRLLDQPRARRRLITWLAERPRSRASAWLQRILAGAELGKDERVLAIQSLPAAWIDHRLASEVLAAAASGDIALANRAGHAATRFPEAVADNLLPEVRKLMATGTAIAELLPCLERLSPAGARALLELALGADPKSRGEVCHWLAARGSKLVDDHVARALDEGKPFPAELLRLTPGVLTTPARVERVVKFLHEQGEPSIAAFEALLDAEVYHETMLAWALADDAERNRRLWRLLGLPREKLPDRVFTEVLRLGDVTDCAHALDSMARGPMPAGLEPRVLELIAPESPERLATAACRVLILWGSEAAGRRAWQTMRAGSHAELAIRWLIEKPKPWTHENLLEERHRLGKPADEDQRRHLQRVLIALARLGDRGSAERLVEEIPFLGPAEMQQAQAILGEVLKAEDFARLVARYLDVPQAKRADAIDEDRRVELLEWLQRTKVVDLEGLLMRLWQEDADYEMRLAALRGLLALDSEQLHGKLRAKLAEPFGEEQQELAFEAIGCMNLPLSPRSLELLAHIVLRAPLIAEEPEIRASIAPGYDAARCAYPLIAPASNLLRRDETARPGKAFAAVDLEDRRFAINRQRFGLFLAGIARRTDLLDDLGPVLARWILAAPDQSPDFVAPAELVLAAAAERAGRHDEAARRYAVAARGFNRGIAPDHVRRAFLDVADPLAEYHPLARLTAKAAVCAARALHAQGDERGVRRELLRAADLAEGDRATRDEIQQLRKELKL